MYVNYLRKATKYSVSWEGSVLAHEDVGLRNRRFVLNEVMRHTKISRTQIASNLQLNIASVSRISRELIDAGLLKEAEAYGSSERPGRKFIGLELNGGGGYIIGIGINAFRQSVTLANLENKKIDEWIAPSVPGPDGEAFMIKCASIARDMVDTHVADKERFLGVGIAVAGELDEEKSILVSSPAMGWKEPIDLGRIIKGALDSPLVIDTPSSAINKAEAGFGIARDQINPITIHCSLGFGMGIQVAGGDRSERIQFGRTLIGAFSPMANGKDLSSECGGLAILKAALGNSAIDDLNDHQRSETLNKLVSQANNGDTETAELFAETGRNTANCFLLCIDLLRPDMIILAGPQAYSNSFKDSFAQQLSQSFGYASKLPQVVVSEMTSTGASRWLSLHGNVINGNLNLASLRTEIAA